MSPACSFQSETIGQAWDEAIPLITANWEETGILSRDDFGPQKSSYLALEEAGRIIAFTAREGASLIGYAIFLLAPTHLHYPKLSWAMQDVLYMDPKYRGLRSVKFIKWQDERLAVMGFDIVYRHVSALNDYSRLLERFAYRKLETSYLRRLSDGR